MLSKLSVSNCGRQELSPCRSSSRRYCPIAAAESAQGGPRRLFSGQEISLTGARRACRISRRMRALRRCNSPKIAYQHPCSPSLDWKGG
jgi:hypothetical protein